MRGSSGGNVVHYRVLDSNILEHIAMDMLWKYPQVSLNITHSEMNCRYMPHHVCLERGCVTCLDCTRRRPCRALAAVFAAVVDKLDEIRRARRSEVCLRSIGVFVETHHLVSLQQLEIGFHRAAMQAIGKFPFPCAVTMPSFDLLNNYDVLGNVHVLCIRAPHTFHADLVAQTNLQQLFLYGMMDRSPRDKVTIAKNIRVALANKRWLSEEELRPISEDLAYALRHQRDLIARKHEIFVHIWFARRQAASVWFRMPKEIMLLIFSFISHKDWIKSAGGDSEPATKKRRPRAITAKKPGWATDIIKDYRALLRQRETLAANTKTLADTRKEQQKHEKALAELPKIIQHQTFLAEESACEFEASKNAFFENYMNK